MSNILKRHVIVFVVLVVGILCVRALRPTWAVDPAQVLVSVRDASPWLPLAFLLLSIARGFLLFAPVFTFSLLGGALFGPVEGFGYAMLGALVCAETQFVFARVFGRAAVQKLIQSQNITLQNADLTSLPSILILRLIMVGVPFDLVNYSLGLTRASVRDYFFGTLVGLVPSTVIYVSLGSTFSNHLPSEWLLAIIVITLISLALLAGRNRNARFRGPGPRSGNPSDAIR